MPEFGKPSIGPELAEPLGQIVILWGTVEHLITLTLGTFLHADLGGTQLVTSSVSVSTQTKWIQGLMALHPHESDQSDRVSEILKRADELRGERNELVHGAWDTTDRERGTALIQTINLDKKEVLRERLITAKDLADLLRDINEWIDDFVVLGRELGFPRHKGSTQSIFAD